MSISIIAGLGNPGIFYRSTRHNIGFIVVDALAKQLGASWKKENRFKAKVAQVAHQGKTLFLVKPLTYMNQSGFSLSAICKFYKVSVESLLVIYDDINIDVGCLKLSQGGSAGGHNGIASIIQFLSTEFLRFRIGIGQKVTPQIDLKDHVLGKFSAAEKGLFTDKIPYFVESLLYVIDHGLLKAMNLINQKRTSHEN
ncbi:MAG: aminoacyl-tRNA hydrolase [Verrucomicrobia bacterium CG_4_10_14_3_um_filter_43_23]|nr:MAG: aminoacyl-tRNA hydrolase [Verrucomicrobia bacterium CG1_02_43_26]PIP59343.1 MAG: aminoacyl-tRNA hydrolase [Verrucomicrobia bacterium CG22_combo_CG10-13_8_21_14_all_43_17]PIX57968.1 MAG: aminoacyl-tRNA hydrolase [Verrucomicrobia bacterium CG_4_10_14_3_um_filter_43_23]PIY62830.1 MAG: aminoacyl-tRNA hydrolase [Verrucomicrobia bacterium CG_4_10_14_0_8_um_filter_43_34]PJA44705.1 MAG: aminoacyl-tRNA hydrolase [Verrucomicrobia bacterium CG_4_9_14_3_um_filter_43_20]